MSEFTIVRFPKSELYTHTLNSSLEELNKIYETYNAMSGLVASEVTFTVAPDRCKDIQSVKKRIIHICSRRIEASVGCVAYVLTRENHENGWPHVHGIVWYPKDQNNAKTLSGGRIYKQETVEENGKTKKRMVHLFNELGRTQIDLLRTEPYVQNNKLENNNKINNKSYLNWLDYIVKDQEIKWKIKNGTGRIKQTKLEWFDYKEPEEID